MSVYRQNVKHLNPSPLPPPLLSRLLLSCHKRPDIFICNINHSHKYFNWIFEQLFGFFLGCVFGAKSIVVIQLFCQFSVSCHCALALKYVCIGILTSLPEHIIAIILRLVGLSWKSFILVLSCQSFLLLNTIPVAHC